MPADDNVKVSKTEAGWYSRLSSRSQALALAALMFAISTGLFLLGLHDMHAGGPLTNMAGKSDWSDSFMFSAGAFVLGACLLAVAFGWKPGRSKNPPST